MNDNTPGAEKLRAITDETHYLGTDADGIEHFCEMARSVVWVETADGQLASIQRIPSLADYVDHVAGVCGWDEVNYDDRSLDEVLAEIVENATGQMGAA